MKKLIYILAILLFFPIVAYSSNSEELTDERIRQLLIQESINSYPGSCPCPYYTDRAGRRCGKRSAYSRPGGYSPLCYADDISDEMVKQYREAKYNIY